MRSRRRRQVTCFAGLLVFGGLFVALNSMVPPARCRDGTSSDAIGIRGACSHHGGVERFGHLSILAFVFRVMGGAVAGRLVMPKESPRAPTREEIIIAAIKSKARIEFFYAASGEVSPTRRVLRPEALAYSPGYRRTLCVTGFCELRQGTRTFDVDRMKQVVALAPGVAIGER